MADNSDGQASCSSTGEVNKDDDDDILTSTGAWISDWWQSTKEKSTSAFEFMKRDITEFTQVVQHDTLSVVSSTTAILKEKLGVDDSNSVAGRAKQSFSNLFSTVSGAFYPVREADSDELVLIKDSEAVVLDKWQAELYQIRCDFSTFSHEPRGSPEHYQKWLETFDLQDKQHEINNLLQHCPEVRSTYHTLVPSSVSESEFWQRYFYRIWQLKESRRADLFRRTQPTSLEEEFSWDDDEQIPSVGKTIIEKPVLTSKGTVSSGNEHTSSGKPSSPHLTGVGSNLVRENVSLATEILLSKTATESDSSNVSPPSCDSSEKGTSDEWEKDFDVELNTPLYGATSGDNTAKATEQDEDWENF